jgi:hypothetical protein
LTLGMTELLAAGGVLRLSGVPDTPRARRTVRGLGLRECGHAAAIFAAPRLVWTRVAGDVLDVALLVKGASSARARRGRAAAVATALTAIGAADAAAAAAQLRR